MQSELNFMDLQKENKKIKYIISNTKVNKMINKILINKQTIIACDIEAALEMSRFGIMCLIQVNKCLLKYKR